jgi:hypothetical protein
LQRNSFIENLAAGSILDRAIVDRAANVVPMATPFRALSIGFEADIRGIGQPIALSAAEVTGDQVPRLSVAVICVLSKQLIEAGEVGQQFFERQLRRALHKRMNLRFMSLITTDSPEIPAATFPAAIAAAVAGLVTSEVPRVYLVIPVTLAKQAVLMSTPDGQLLYPTLTLSGGFIASVPTMVVSDAEMGADDAVVAFDASMLAANAGDIDFAISTEADVQMLDAPLAGAQPMSSLWQSGMVGLRAVREFGAAFLDPMSIRRAVITS